MHLGSSGKASGAEINCPKSCKSVLLAQSVAKRAALQISTAGGAVSEAQISMNMGNWNWTRAHEQKLSEVENMKSKKRKKAIYKESRGAPIGLEGPPNANDHQPGVTEPK